MSSSSLSSSDTTPPESIIENNIHNDEFCFIFFDIETGGFALTCDVLQIAMKCNKAVFNMYINPTQYIPERVTEINGLTSNGSNLYHRGTKLESYPLKVVLKMLLEYLQSKGTPCILVAHNCTFDAPRLIKIIEEVSLLDEFREVIAGFVDSLPMFRKKFPKNNSKGQYKLTTLATEVLQLSIENAHDAIFDVEILEKLVLDCFKPEELLENMETFDCKVQQFNDNKRTQIILKTLLPLEAVISDEMRTRLARAGISYNSLVETYKRCPTAAVQLLEQSVDGKPQAIKNKKILNEILEYLKNK